MEERPIAFNLLHKDELEYEVIIRGDKPTYNVSALRAQVRSLNKDIPTDEIATCDLDVNSEIGTIKNKLESLHTLCSDAAYKPPSIRVLNRIQALSHHLYHRLSRLSPDGDQMLTVKTFADRLNKMLLKCDNILHNFKSSAVATTQPNPTADELPRLDSYDRYSAIHTLNLKFNGKTCVKAFIQRLEELCQ
ncbi:unnamed protein product [Arctia plantaginis]|uniref:Uncharacterized protein n=1 Tax=Arctia plantaginis TaxID=874455 RepID=A0A8S1APJ1_ARCPL|nr:unnamed protein product [Arctia plantaginis]